MAKTDRHCTRLNVQMYNKQLFLEEEKKIFVKNGIFDMGSNQHVRVLFVQ